jgi:hypothetical protein
MLNVARFDNINELLRLSEDALFTRFIISISILPDLDI